MTNWQKIKLGNACTLIKGVTYKSEDYASAGDGLVFLSLKSIAKGGGFNFDGVKYYKGKASQDQFVKPDDLIIANTDLTRAGDVIGAPVFIPRIDNQDKYVFSMDITKILTDESRLSRNFLYHYLLTNKVRNYMKGISNGSTVLHLKVNLVNDLDIPLPPLKMQIKIAQSLSDVDAQIRNTDQMIQKTEVLKQGLMRELLTKGIGHKKFQKTKMGEIPEKWEISSILDADIEIIDGDRGTNYPKHHEFYSEGFCLFLSNRNIHNDSFDFSESIFISQEKDSVLRKGRLNRWDVVLTTRGTVGNVAIYDDSVAYDCIRINSGMLIFRTGKSISPEFLYYLLKSPLFKERYLQLGSGSAQPQLPIGSLRSLLIPILPKEEQLQIVNQLKTLDLKHSSEIKHMTLLQQLKEGLMQDIFSQKSQVN